VPRVERAPHQRGEARVFSGCFHEGKDAAGLPDAHYPENGSIGAYLLLIHGQDAG
jgi:hypothetical protein